MNSCSTEGYVPKVRLIAAGGVNPKTARGFILAGATALGIGKELVSSDIAVDTDVPAGNNFYKIGTCFPSSNYIGWGQCAKKNNYVLLHREVHDVEINSVTGRGAVAVSRNR